MRARMVVQPRLGKRAAAWDALVDDEPLASPFLRSWWLEATAGARPQFVFVLNGEQLLGGVAFEEDRRMGMPRLRVLGAAMCPDHLDLIARRGHESDVTAAIAGWLTRAGGRIVELEGMAKGSRLALALPGHVRSRIMEVAPWTPLPDDPDDYLRSRPSRLRHTALRSERRLHALGVRYDIVESSDADAALDDLLRLHRALWREHSTFVPVFERFRAAARVGIARGELVLHRLAFGDDVIAIHAYFETGNRMSFYQSGRDPDVRWRGAGTVLHLHAARRACRLGFRELDMLRGAEAYKTDWADHARPLLRHKTSHGLTGRLASAATMAGGLPSRLRGSP